MAYGAGGDAIEEVEPARLLLGGGVMKIYSSAFQAINRSGRQKGDYAVVARLAQRHLSAYKRYVVNKRLTTLK